MTPDPWGGMVDLSAGSAPQSLPSMATWQLLRRKNDGAMFMHDPQTGNMVAYPGGEDQPVTPAEKPSTATDVAKSAGSGLERGVTGLAGMIPSMEQGARAAANKYLFDPVLGKMPEGGSKPPDAANVLGTQALNKVVPGANYQPQTTPGKFAQTIGEFAPGAAIAPGNTAANLVRGAVIPGAASEAAGEATQGTPYEGAARMAGAIAGGSAATPLTNIPGRMISPNPMPAERAGLVGRMENEGVPLTAGQQADRKLLRWAEGTLGGGAEINRTQLQKFTQGALKRSGIDEASLQQAGVDVPSPLLATQDVRNAGRAVLNKGFEDIGARNTLAMDQKFGQDISSPLAEYKRLVGPNNQAPGVEADAKDLLTKSITSATMPGDEYQAYRSRFSKTAEKLKTSDPQQAEAYRGFRNALDNAMERSVNPDDAGEWAKLRSKWANLDAIDKAASTGTPEAAQGYITPQALRTGIGNYAYRRGQGDLAPLARAGVGTMTPFPQSGTEPRSYVRKLTELIGSAGVGELAGGGHGAALGALGAIAGPWAAGKALMWGPTQRYLANQVAPRAGLISPRNQDAFEVARGTNLLQSLFNQPGQVDQQSGR